MSDYPEKQSEEARSTKGGLRGSAPNTDAFPAAHQFGESGLRHERLYSNHVPRTTHLVEQCHCLAQLILRSVNVTHIC